MDIREIKERLNRQADAVCVRLLPDVRREGHEWAAEHGGGKVEGRAHGVQAGVW